VLESCPPRAGPPWYLFTVSAQYIPFHELSRSYQHILLLVYYKLFDETGPLNIKHPIYSNNLYIGRVDANSIPRPHDVSSLVQRICAKEEKGYDIDWDQDTAYSNELFETISSRKAFDPQEPLSLLGTNRPGSRPQDPLVLKVGFKGMLK
jgi:hypothetical protein